MLFDDLFAPPAKPSVQPSSPVVQFSADKERAHRYEQQSEAVSLLFEQCGLPDSVTSSLTVNTSTISIERQPPTYEEKIRALWDIWTFCDILNFHGGSLAFSECHRETVAWKFRPNALLRQLVLEARGMLKSTLYCVLYCLWRIYQNPNIRMFVGTESLRLSKAFIREIESYLTDDWLKEHLWNDRPHFSGPLIPEMDSLGKSRRALVRDISSEFGDEFSTDANASAAKKVWRAEAIQVVRTRQLKEPTVTAGSVGQTSTGFHFDELVFDDVHTFKNCSTVANIEKVYSWIYDMESVLDPPYIDVELTNRFYSTCPSNFSSVGRWALSGGRMTVLGTRYDEKDYYGHIIENAEALGYEVHERNIYVNGVDNSDGYRWPEKWNEQLERSILAQFQTKLGSAGVSRFFSQYVNKLVNYETQTFDWDKVNYIRPGSVVLDEQSRFVRIFNADGTVQATFRPRLCVDPTSTFSKTSDFAALAVGGVYENKLYVIDFWMKQAKIDEWVKQLWHYVDKWNLFDAVIEMVAGFKVVEFALRQMWLNDESLRPLSIHPFSPPTNTGEGKAVRIEAILSPVISNGLLYLPAYCASNTELQTQFKFFGKATVHDDGPDVLTMLREHSFIMKPPVKNKKPSYTVHPVHGGVVYLDEHREEDDWDAA